MVRVRLKVDVCPACLEKLRRAPLGTRLVTILTDCPKCRDVAPTVRRALYVNAFRRTLGI